MDINAEGNTNPLNMKMNFKKFYDLMSHHPQQDPVEWQLFIEFIKGYFGHRGIEKPLILEIGIRWGNQKPFYADFLGFDHIGLDVDPKYNATITGDSHDPKTLARVLKLTRGREINLVFIDACHKYEDVKKDFEMYGPLATDIVALHDVMMGKRFWNTARGLWMEILADPGNYTTIQFFTNRAMIPKPKNMGIGLLIKWGERCTNLPY